MLNVRQKKILKTIVDKYIIENSSVSSLYLSKTQDLKEWSSATIRNDMVILEEKGYLKKEYYSSGKIPTKLGYKFYIESLMDKFEGDKTIEDKMIEIFSDRHSSLDEILDRCANLVSEFLSLPAVLIKNKSNHGEYLRRIDIVNLEKNKYIIYLITSSGNIIQDYLFLDDFDKRKKEDLMASIRLLNERLFNSPIESIHSKLFEVIPQIKKQVHQFEFIYETIISQMIIKKLLNSNLLPPKIYNAKFLISLPEVQRNEITVETIFDILENNSPLSPVNFNYLKTGKTLFNLDGEGGISIATINLDINLTTHQLSIIGPVRMNYSLIKYLFEFINEKLRN